MKNYDPNMFQGRSKKQIDFSEKVVNWSISAIIIVTCILLTYQYVPF